MNHQKHLSYYGIGPVFTVISVVLTGAACLLDGSGKIPRWVLPGTAGWLRILAVLLAAEGAWLWLNSFFVQRISNRIRDNELVTTGAYAWVRNPIYTAIMLVMWAVLLWRGNLLLLVLLPVYPLVMTVLLRPTEEKWLTQLYGQVYLDYCRRVNRCIPWFPRR